jgi:hypothetical protein
MGNGPILRAGSRVIVDLCHLGWYCIDGWDTRFWGGDVEGFIKVVFNVKVKREG